MGLRHDILNEPVSELELREVLRARRGMTVREAVQIMRQHALGYVVLLDDDDKPLHMFTERMLIKIVLSGQSHMADSIDQYYYKKADTIRQDQPIADLLHMLTEGGLRFVCVVDAEGKMIGVTGQKGVMEYIADHFPRSVKVQDMAAKVSMSQREGA